ncbi:hypothetical protein [Sandaracinus amylolyticus]|uniref:Uncharacterized protein n=1 Tax=Sandaracinus amylolyticus TaxID=927083 RepID=A0A0F6YKJ4_9BACT|nr:hypothetical protein [Sandaracinus amylolyticus]AKF08213.1 Hypothetical protein DB32_005362 [Sandaracinus amylolyticus]
MSGTDDKRGADIDFDWDDALADWERDLDDKSEARSGPMPQKPAGATPAKEKEPARALYRPPDPSEFKRPVPRGAPPARPEPPKPAPPPPRVHEPVLPPAEDVHVSFDDDDDDDEHTRIASIPKELIASLVTARERDEASSEQHRLSTRPPPPGMPTSDDPIAVPPAAPPPIDLDLDDMLDGLDQDTRAYPVDVPRFVSPIRGRTSAPPGPASVPPPPASEAPAPPSVGTPTARPGAPDEDPLALALPSAPPAARTPSPEGAPPTSSTPPRKSLLPSPSDLSWEEMPEPARPTREPLADADALEDVSATPSPGARAIAPPPPARSEETPAPPPPPSGSAAAAALRAAVAARNTGGAAPLRPPAPEDTTSPSSSTPPKMPPLPRPGAAAAGGKPVVPLPRPGGLPPLPRPPGARVSVPQPGAPRVPPPPGVPAPRPPVVPRPGADVPAAVAPPPEPQAVALSGEQVHATPVTAPNDRAALDVGAPSSAVVAVSSGAAERPVADDDFAFLDALEAPAPKAAPAPEPADGFGGLLPVDDDEGGEEPSVAEVSIRVSEPDLVVAPASSPAPDDDEPEIAAIAPDDGEPELAAITPDDDEPELAAITPDDDEPEARVESVTDSEPAPAAPAPAAPVPAAAAARDRGAAAARRTVRSRKPRVEVFPLVGRGADALAARRDLLLRLAEGRSGSQRARLLLAAAELDHQLGRADDAREHTLLAREADASDPVVVRAARRDALARAAYDEAAALLEAEIALPLAPPERVAALLTLAEVRLQQLGDASGAERAALDALELAPRSVAAALVLASARAASGAGGPAVDALSRAADAWDDPRARAALRVTVAREAERTGDRARAATLHASARTDDPQALDAALGVARTEAGVPQADALEALARPLPEGALRDALLRRAALALVTSTVRETRGEERTSAARRALDMLEDARALPALRTRALAASFVGDVDVELSTLEAWAGASGGTDRALAMVRLAEKHGATGDLAAADATLHAAALADASLSTIRIVREVLARRAGNRALLVEAVESAGALAAAAKLAIDPASTMRERELLGEARRADEAPLTAEVLWLDLAAGAADAAEVASALRHEVDRTPPERRTGALLALADRALEEGDAETAERTLREARDLAPGDATVLRPLGRLAAARSPRDAAALWLEEATAASGARAAFAAATAGLLLEAAEGDAIGAYRRALDAMPGYGPALWSLEPVARAAGDAITLVDVHEQSADGALTEVDAAASLVRAALLRAESDPASASALLARAREKTPHDAVLVDLVLRLGDALTPDERAQLTLSLAEGAPRELARAIELSAAASLEDAGEPGRAAEIYRALAERHPNDPLIALPLDRAELHAGETSRVAERRFAAVRDAADDALRVLALERLAELDLEERDDAASGVLSLVSILEVSPGHVPSLRTLERYYLEQDRREDLAGIEERLAMHLETPEDAAVHLRLAARLKLAGEGTPGDAADAVLVGAAPRVRMNAWLARRIAAAARAAGASELETSTTSEIASRLPTPLARTAGTMRVADLRAAAGDFAGAASVLATAVEASPDHPFAAERLARLREGAGDARGAAEALAIAARAAHVPGRAASLWYRAGVLWQDTIGDEELALEALTEASKVDVGHLDVFDRLRNLLELREDHAALSELVARRTAAGGGDPALLVELHALQAKLKEKLGDREGAREALRAVLALSPEMLDALRRLAELCLEDEDYRNAAEALIRIARIRKDREELRWVFFTLGEIYDRHIPDAKRAEAAYRRVLKLAPDDVTAMERLAALFRRDNQLQAAAEQLGELSRVEPDPDRARGHQLALAEVLEQMGDPRRAEQVLETARRAAPTELGALKALADFYTRQRAMPAHAMHLNRAVADFRHALGNDLSDAAAWLGLVEVLGWRGRGDAARVAAGAAFALGVTDLEISRLVDAQGGVPGVGAAAADAALDDLLAPQGLPAALRAVLRSAGPVLEKVLPFDPRAYRAEKLGARDGAIRAAAVDVAKWFGIPDVEIWITPGAPRVCVPVSSGPPVALMIGRDLLAVDDRERLFVLARALKIASLGLSVAVRSQPQELVLAMAGLVHNFDPHYAPGGIDPAALGDWSKRVARQLPRRLADELGPVVFEMAGAPDYEPTRLAMAASELGDRVALLAGGSIPAGLSALLRLSGENGLAESTSTRVAQLRRFPEVLSLASFAVSDVHFDARQRAGADKL